MEVSLRAWREDDIPVVAKHANNQKIADNLRDNFPMPYTEDDARFLLNAQAKPSPMLLRFAVDVDGEAAGCISVERIRQPASPVSGELGYWLGEAYWGRGVMPQAVRQICKLAFEQLKVERIYAEVFAFNSASIRVLEKSGFTLERTLRRGAVKNGKHTAVHVYSLVKQDFHFHE